MKLQEFVLFCVYCVSIPLLLGLPVDLIAPHYGKGIIWLSVFVSFSSERCFQQDYDDGTLEHYWSNRWSFNWIIVVELVVNGFKKTSLLFLVVFGYSSSFALETAVGMVTLLLLVACVSCLTLSVRTPLLYQLSVFPFVLPVLSVWTMSFDIVCAYSCFVWCITLFFLDITFKTVMSLD
jgi:ABC-type transport system involved in cytochrome c biogenesis permease component